MNKINKHIAGSIFVFLFFTLGSLPVYGQTQGQRSLPEPLCEKKGIKFPIEDLGGCKDYFSCRNFCSDPQNAGKCARFAKEKKITQAEVAETEEFIRFQGKVSKEFGCKGRADCKLVCNNPDNFDKCHKLAKESKIAGGFIDNPGHKDVLKDAKQALGCTTQAECKSLCEKKENQDKCNQFAKDVGLAGGTQAVGPGGCRSADTCQDFCKIDANGKECSSFGVVKAKAKESSEPVANQQPGPGGCKSDAECNDYCTKNYTDSQCQEYAAKNGFTGPGGCSTQDACTAYCQANYQDSECAKYGSTYGFKGPGGCSDVSSCTSYCQTNYSDAECQKYSAQYGGFNGPGGCKDQASCISHCTANLDDPECQKLIEQYGGGSYKDQYEQKKKEY